MTHVGNLEFVIPNHLNLWFHLDKRISFQINCLAVLAGKWQKAIARIVNFTNSLRRLTSSSDKSLSRLVFRVVI